MLAFERTELGDIKSALVWGSVDGSIRQSPLVFCDDRFGIGPVAPLSITLSNSIKRQSRLQT